jgi:hypothetical protein
MYVGGAFHFAGGKPAAYVATWNPAAQTWSALAGPMIDNTVHALAWAGDHLVVGGTFDKIGTDPTLNHVAAYTGTGWQALATGIPGGDVTALAYDSTAGLYAAGSFTAPKHVAHWDGVAWQAVGSGFNQPVHALVFDSKHTLYAGGEFDQSGSATTNAIAKIALNGADWTPLGSGLTGGNVYSLATEGTYLYAGGTFTKATYTTIPGDILKFVAVGQVAAWSIGFSTWSAMSSGLNNQVMALTSGTPGRVYAGGYFRKMGMEPPW